MRKIAIVTGTRAEYGLLYWIIKGIHEDPQLLLQLIVTGTHLSPEFGMTVHVIEQDGFPIAERVEMLLSADTESALAASMGLGMIGFAKTYERLRPDILVVLGDRFEILSAVAAAIPFRIPVAHIHGGESTTGAIDELFRHAITKMSHIHFPATSEYAERIKQMGEPSRNIFCYGSPAIDNINKLDLLSEQAIRKKLAIPQNKRIGILTYHPETLGSNKVRQEMKYLLTSLRHFSDVFWILTMPNADTGSRAIVNAIKEYSTANPGTCTIFTSLGQLHYLSLLKHAAVMVGNSSSGLIEAPSFALPVVNIGDRQGGRLRAQNIIDVKKCQKKDIVPAISKALSSEFRLSLRGMKNPYGSGDASSKIVNVLASKVKDINITTKIFQKMTVK